LNKLIDIVSLRHIDYPFIRFIPRVPRNTKRGVIPKRKGFSQSEDYPSILLKVWILSPVNDLLSRTADPVSES